MNIDETKIKKILFIVTGGIGDMVLFTPAVRAVRDKFPQAELGMLVSHLGAEHVWKSSDWISRWYVINPQRFEPFKSIRLILQLRSAKYDMSISASGVNPKKASMLGRISGIKYRVGESFSGINDNYNIHIPYNDKTHQVDGNLRIAEAISATIKNAEPFYPMSAEYEKEADKVLHSAGIGQNEKLAAFHPGSGKILVFKRWAPERFRETVQRIADEKGLRPVILGGAEESEIGDFVAGERGVSLVGKLSLGGTAALLKRAQVMVSNDTGLMHIAAAVGCKVIAIFGPTMPWKTAPYGKQHVVIRKEMDCMPCYRYSLKKTDCRRECLEQITPDDILKHI